MPPCHTVHGTVWACWQQQQLYHNTQLLTTCPKRTKTGTKHTSAAHLPVNMLQQQHNGQHSSPDQCTLQKLFVTIVMHWNYIGVWLVLGAGCCLLATDRLDTPLQNVQQQSMLCARFNSKRCQQQPPAEDQPARISSITDTSRAGHSAPPASSAAALPQVPEP